jgi:amino acid adenylation domain-containing protein
MNSEKPFECRDEIAVIGMAGRFPGARNVNEFWQNLTAGIESISFFSDEELKSLGLHPDALSSGTYVRAKAMLEDTELFDAPFFDFNLKEAELTDPQHRIFLECAWEALENAGYDCREYKGSVGVFAGASTNLYLMNLLSRPGLIKTVGLLQAMIGNDKDHLATRVSYKLNLSGPSLSIQTACSTSLVATHLACQSLLGGECDIALAGGVSVTFPQKRGYSYVDGGILSPDGHCRVFDARAAGTVPGNGAGIVVLRRLADALADGDFIHAVIKASAINNDGALKVGYTAPGVDGQARVVLDALEVGGVSPETVTYVEAHGTGTTLGDPIEVSALTQAFRAAGTKKKNFCAIGSVKSNIGHLDAAAGVVGLIKTVLALEHKLIPPSLHFQEPNPRIDFENSPFYVNAKLSHWEASGTPRRAGVSSFGIGGTNAHLVLEEAPRQAGSRPGSPRQLLVLSAKTASALEIMTSNLARHLELHPDTSLADTAFTLKVGRGAFGHRRMLLCRDVDDCVAVLRSLDRSRLFTSFAEERSNRPIAFMFAGQGTQHVNMGLELYQSQAVFRQQVDLCSALLEPHLGLDLRGVIYPSGQRFENAELKLNETAITQPALFVIEYALAKMWAQLGVHPRAMIGHSIGEYVAACLAGVFSLDEGLKLVAARGRLMQELPAGAMLAIALPETRLKSMLNERISLAAINGPSRSVVSGPTQDIDELEESLKNQGTTCRRLRTSHAFHSNMMAPMLERFHEQLRSVTLSAPKIPYLSNLTGTWITAAEAMDPNYWAAHLRETVRFGDGLEHLLKTKDRILLEVGPDQTLSTLAKQDSSKLESHLMLSSLGPPNKRDSQEALLNTLGMLWLAGVGIDWSGFYGEERRQRIPLPTHPFERKRFWIEGPENKADAIGERPASQNVPGGKAFGQANPDPAKYKEASVSEHQLTASDAGDRYPSILYRVKALANELTGVDPVSMDVHATFFELGIDSLLLIQASQSIKERFGIEIPFRMLFEEIATLDEVALYIDRELPPETIPAAVNVPTAPLDSPVGFSGSSNDLPPSGQEFVRSNGAMEWIMAQQLQIISQQLDLLRNGSSNKDHSDSYRPALAPAIKPPSVNGSAVSTSPTPDPLVRAEISPDLYKPAKSESVNGGPETYIPYRPIEVGRSGGLVGRQREYLGRFIERYTKRTRGSKQVSQANRRIMADPRSSKGFRMLWKELIYPIVAARSSGSRMWDVDCNEYVDLTMGFGVHLFGHSPPFIIEALQSQLRAGVELGPQSGLAGGVAELICELTGFDRVAFCNSGTEAVMTAMRVARTITGRNKIALFAGSYHGCFDGTLAKTAMIDGRRDSVPMAPGTPRGMIEDVMVLDYGEPESLEILRAHMDELAAVLVEPVQTRRPDLQPRAFLHDLRRLTERAGTALIFDEVVTGFRAAPGGAQEYFGLKADLATYGKVVGGGMPIGIVAGKAAYMDAFDGGAWEFGDASYPRAVQTFYGATFCKHPLAMAASLAVLNYLKKSGPGFQRHLNERAADLSNSLNAFFQREDVPIRAQNFSSQIIFNRSSDFKFFDLFFYNLIEKGIYVWEGRTCFLSSAHTEEDIDLVALAVQNAIAEMRAGGMMPASASGISTSIPTGVANRSSASLPGQAVAEDVDPAASHQRSAPLSEGQKQLWLVSQMGEDASRAYNESMNLRLRGGFDLAAMRRALQKLVDRHEALRTAFSRDGQHQRISPILTIDIPFEDLSHLGGRDRETRATQSLTREAQQSFNLVDGPLVRARIVKLEQEYHFLVLTFHHLIFDGWSSSVLIGELKSLYSAECKGLPCEMPEAMQYREYVEQTQSLQPSSPTDPSEQYWLSQFGDSVPVLDLPTDRPRPSVRTYNGARVSVMLDAALVSRIKGRSAQQGSTLFMTLLGAFTLLLHRLSGQDDLVVGIASAGQISGGKSVVGHCLNFLPIRAKLAQDSTFAQYITSIKRSVLSAYEHQSYPLSRLTGKLNLPPDPSRHPLIAVAFNLDRSDEALTFFNLKVDVTTVPTGASKLDLTFNVTETEGQLLVDCDYNTDLFDDQTIRRWLGHFETLLGEIVASPDQPTSNLSLLSEDEKHNLIEWNSNSKAARPGSLCVHQMFEQQVDLRPNAIALIFGDRRMTYRELNIQANRIAHRLRSLGVGPNLSVGICAERSPEMMAGVLGVLKAGGAFVPLDPEYPRDRLAFMVEDAHIAVLLTQRRLEAELPEHSAMVLYLDSDWSSAGKGSESNPINETADDNLVYMIYTSGTTGRPKAVMVEHRNLVNCMMATQDRFNLSQDLVLSSGARFTFDITLFELFSPLLVGGTTILLTMQQSLDLAAYGKVLQQVTFFNTLPSLMRQIVSFEKQNGQQNNYDNVKQVLIGGDLVPRDLLVDIAKLFPRAQIHEGYGPTEATILSTTFSVPKDRALQKHIIGKPLNNISVRIYDVNRKHLVPIGIPGEMYIGGAAVTRGYFRREELTADHYLIIDDLRFYKTGDLARYLPDGNIEFLGRIDHQVKIRGFRVELGEIEWVLGSHPDVQAAVVVALEDTPGDKRLVAYLVFVPGASVSVSDLRSFLERKLPIYMVPSAFVVLDALPVTPNGKIDRHSLPSPDKSRPSLLQEFVAPRTPVEEILANIWIDVLGVEQVGVHDKFFELGGDSLLATQIISRVHEALRVNLTLRTFFEALTVAELASAVAKSAQQDGDIPMMASISRGEKSFEDLLDQLDQLSETEVASLLSQELRMGDERRE